MSYILDALRRADAERERGSVPDIHAQPTRAVRADDPARSMSLPAWAWGVGGLLVLVLALMAWRLWSAESPLASQAAAGPATGTTPAGVPATVDLPRQSRPVEAASNSQDSPSPPGSPPPPDARRKSPSVVTGAAAGTSARATTAAKSDGAGPRDPSRIVTGTTPPTVATTSIPSATRPAAATGRPDKPALPAPAATPAPAPAPAAAPAPELKVFAVNELPEDIRRDLPKVAIGGSSYSENPASRFVMVNGQLFHEGDTVVPGVVLQQIKLRSAVLAFRGYRYGVSF